MKNKSFDDVYVMNVTLEHMLRAIDISIGKTLARLPEFEGTKDGMKVMNTLSRLGNLKRTLNAYKEANPSVFKKK